MHCKPCIYSCAASLAHKHSFHNEQNSWLLQLVLKITWISGPLVSTCLTINTDFASSFLCSYLMLRANGISVLFHTKYQFHRIIRVWSCSYKIIDFDVSQKMLKEHIHCLKAYWGFSAGHSAFGQASGRLEVLDQGWVESNWRAKG